MSERTKKLGVALAVCLVLALLYKLVFPGPKLLVGGAFLASHPVWSPDGTKIAFFLDGPGLGANVGVYDVRIRTHRLLGQVMRGEPLFSWSPDSRKLAFSVPEENYAKRTVVVADVSGVGEATKLAAGNSPTFSLDGGSLIMVCDHLEQPRPLTDKAPNYCRVDVETGQITWLKATAWSSPPPLSLVHELAVYSVSKGTTGQAEVVVQPIDAFPWRDLTTGGRSTAAGWTPDGREALYVRGNEIRAINPDGGADRLIFSGPEGIEAASVQLSPDGRRVYFAAPVIDDPGSAEAATGERGTDLHMAWLASPHKAKRLANRHPFKRRYAISPDGKRLVYEVITEHNASRGILRSELWMMGL